MAVASIDAYDLASTVARYDADMQIMHPNRDKMISVALDAITAPRNAQLKALDLGVGTGCFSFAFLDAFPNAKVTAVDGAAAMIELAKVRLGARAERVQFVVGDFRKLDEVVADEDFDVVFSSFALHHLDVPEKIGLLEKVHSKLKPGGWLFNADIVTEECPLLEKVVQDLRVNGIVERAAGRDPRFADYGSTRKHLDDLEARDNDKPQTLTRDLQSFREAGFKSITNLWKETREVVLAAIR